MSDSVNGSQRGVQDEIKRRIQRQQLSVGVRDNHVEVNNNFDSVLKSASAVHRRIVVGNRINNYGSYKPLHTHSDADCASQIINILRDLLPKLIKTLKFLLQKVGQIDDAHWGGQRCDGERIYGPYRISGSGGVELKNWLIDQNHDPVDSLERGYSPYELSSHTGDAFKAFLDELVKPGQNTLGKLLDSITQITPYGIRQVNSPPSLPSPDVSSRGFNGGNGGHRYNGFNSQPSGPTPSTHRPSTPSPRQQMQTSPNSGSPQPHTEDHGDSGTSYGPHKNGVQHQSAGSSTATIGGAVGATGLVGGGAAVYFLNVGGIRTLIAG
ncbi:1-phosphatidylinositol 4,5-bisphosphate phosphodiesterase beta-2 [Babesia caballi]|uniref:1-phosphatidylinositol 4,5-bisphosphate phosphodiesterase beta-2 n=1 Tax=Babesia caballi TaxID=5871 RepID=A0AAV4M043_BABCB|nr:1-phosphatidylinositol 4,5-bisphosphate phosphodiesterase beta-2 [Babesia caballi]